MRDLIVAAIVFGLLPFVLKRPFWGILLMAWLGYMNPHRLCYGFMFSLPTVQIVAAVTLIGMLMSKEAKRMVWSREVIVLMIFVAWMGISTTQAIDMNLAPDQFIKVVKIQILGAMTLLMLTSRQRIDMFLWVIVLSIGFYGVKGGLFTIANGGSFRVSGPPGSFIGGNNEVALAFVMTIPLMRYLHIHAKDGIVRTGLAVSMLLTALATIGSQSRGALLALSVMGAIFWLKGRNKLLTGALISVVVVAVIIVMPESWYQRMDTIGTYQSDASAMGRINAWWVAWNMAKDRFFGGGFEAFGAVAFQKYAPDPDDVHDVHSIYFEVLGEHGFVGLLLFLTLLVLTWQKCNAIIRIGKRDPDKAWASDLAAMIQVSIAGYMVAGAFLGMAYFDYIYHLVALVVVAYALVHTRMQFGRTVEATGAYNGRTLTKLSSPSSPTSVASAARMRLGH